MDGADCTGTGLKDTVYGYIDGRYAAVEPVKAGGVEQQV